MTRTSIRLTSEFLLFGGLFCVSRLSTWGVLLLSDDHRCLNAVEVRHQYTRHQYTMLLIKRMLLRLGYAKISSKPGVRNYVQNCQNWELKCVSFSNTTTAAIIAKTGADTDPITRGRLYSQELIVEAISIPCALGTRCGSGLRCLAYCKKSWRSVWAPRSLLQGVFNISSRAQHQGCRSRYRGVHASSIQRGSLCVRHLDIPSLALSQRRLFCTLHRCSQDRSWCWVALVVFSLLRQTCPGCVTTGMKYLPSTCCGIGSAAVRRMASMAS
ncbi:hypothetical protein T440DRAFT_272197 [Plenodomus tracheiphilus IPT5]|uniref:Uncharacterized protein n=1 Tax=Plenodomus tracheiphilus IPT5 TaxID=1408161 RepID=A0A6A7BFT4_9PLEO|nr:hypothetical protein T440DRAFT_272197 [Plenodomus tracheiphilus IPT5]